MVSSSIIRNQIQTRSKTNIGLVVLRMIKVDLLLCCLFKQRSSVTRPQKHFHPNILSWSTHRVRKWKYRFHPQTTTLCHGLYLSESNAWDIEDQAFSRSNYLAPPSPLPPLPLVSSTGNTWEDWERETTFCGKGVGDETNHTTARKSGPLEIIQYSLLPPIDPLHAPPWRNGYVRHAWYEEPERSLLEMLQGGLNFGRVVQPKYI
jgi:hypothetical protein